MPVTVSMSTSSVAVAETPRVKSASLLAGGVMVSPDSSEPFRVQEPSRLSTPAESTAPSGTPEMVTLRLSEPSRSVRPAAMSRLIAWSSVPAESFSTRIGRSASAAVETAIVPVTVAVSVPSVAVAETSRVKSASLLAGGVMVRPDSWEPSRVWVPSPLSMPADRTAPSGTPEMVTLRLSEPSRSVRPAAMSRLIG